MGIVPNISSQAFPPFIGLNFYKKDSWIVFIECMVDNAENLPKTAETLLAHTANAVTIGHLFLQHNTIIT